MNKEINDIKNEAYDGYKIYEYKMKYFHDKQLRRKFHSN